MGNTGNNPEVNAQERQAMITIPLSEWEWLKKTVSDTNAKVKQNKEAEKENLSFKEAAKMLNISNSTLQRYIADGKIACVQAKKNCARIIKRSDLDDFMNEQQIDV